MRARVQELRRELDGARALRKAWRSNRGLQRVEGIKQEALSYGYAPLEAELLYELAELQQKLNKASEAETTLHLAIEAAARAQDDTLVARTWVSLVFVVGYDLARHDEALALRRTAAAAVLRSRDSLAQAELDATLSAVFLQKGEYRTALLHAQALTELGAVVARQGQLERARTLFERAESIFQGAGTDHRSELAALLNAMAMTSARNRDFDDARARFDQAKEVWGALHGLDHPEVATVLHNLGNVHAETGKMDEAKAYFDRALAIREQVLGSNHPSTASTLGRWHASSGDYKSAKSYFERIQKIQASTLPADHPRIATTLAVTGMFPLP